WLAAHVLLIGIMLPGLKAPKTRRPTLLPPPAGRISDDVRRILRNMIYCRSRFPAAYQRFGFAAEWANLATIRRIYRSGPGAEGGRRDDRSPPEMRWEASTRAAHLMRAAMRNRPPSTGGEILESLPGKRESGRNEAVNDEPVEAVLV